MCANTPTIKSIEVVTVRFYDLQSYILEFELFVRLRLCSKSLGF